MPAGVVNPLAQMSTAGAVRGSSSSVAPPAITNQDWQELSNLMQGGNYSGAFGFANQFQSHNQAGYSTDPLMQQLTTAGGIQQLGVGQMTPQQINQFYSAASPYFNDNGAGPGVGLGKNPYGSTLWGSYSNLTRDAAQNAQAGGVPDLARYAGAQPDQSFMHKYGAPIIGLLGAVAAPWAIPALAGALGLGTLGAAGSAIAGGLYGAGTGALSGEVSGGNVGRDALLGGVGGAVAGSGLYGQIGQAAGGGLPGQVASTVAGNVGNNLISNAIGNGGSMAGNPSQGAFNYGGLLQNAGNIYGNILDMNSTNAVGNNIQNAYTSAINAGHLNPYQVSGPGGIGAGLGLNGSSPTNFGINLGAYSSPFGAGANMAGAGANSAMGYLGSPMLGGAQAGAFGTGMAGLGQMGNPLIGQAFGAAGNMLGQANGGYTQNYNSALQQNLAALARPQALQMAQLQNAQFQRGQMGSTGGALQTEAMAQGFGNADLQAAISAQNQALNTQALAGNQASQFANLGLGQLTGGAGIANQGFGTFGNLQNTGFNQGLGAFNSGIAGGTNLNSMGLGNANLAYSLMGLQNQAQQGSALNQIRASQIGMQNEGMGAGTGVPGFLGQLMGYGAGGYGSMLGNLGGIGSSISNFLGLGGNANAGLPTNLIQSPISAPSINLGGLDTSTPLPSLGGY